MLEVGAYMEHKFTFGRRVPFTLASV